MTEHFDVLVVGAGLAGIAAAYRLQIDCPRKSYLIVEGRAALGGTWDLFRYPGLRSDADMHTYCFSFRPWAEETSIAPGASILKYLQETAQQFGIDRHIRYSQRVVEARWSSMNKQWTVTLVGSESGERTTCTCAFLYMCTGYYNYEQGYAPEFPGAESFEGRIVHPQQWPADLEYAGKQVVIIGSGATAVTLLPAMAKTAAHATMLQRSPTYIVSRPGKDDIGNWMKSHLPFYLASKIVRLKNVFIHLYLYMLSRKKPEKVKAGIIARAQAEFSPDYDMTHFTPNYMPWDQRMCLVPDGDLFQAIRSGQASIVTDTIDHFTPHGIKLQSGKEIPADVIVTATGLKMQLMSGIRLFVDDQPVELAKTFSYKGTMFSGVPNLGVTVGYTNAPWTLKAELASTYFCRLINYMDRKGWKSAVPQRGEDTGEQPLINLTSGYFQRALEQLPKLGSQKPWSLGQSYQHDIVPLRYGKVNDGSMQFSK